LFAYYIFILQPFDNESRFNSCNTCIQRMLEFYQFKLNAKNFMPKISNTKNQQKSIAILNNEKRIKSFIQKHKEVVIEENDNELTIKPKSFQISPLIKIKQENIEIKVEPKSQEDESDSSFLQFCRSFGESASSFHSDESTTSCGDANSSLSRLPAFEQNTYFDGNRFVLKSEVPPKSFDKDKKKRQRKPESWGVNIQKQLKNAGKRYRSTKGYVVAEKSIRNPCQCRKMCSSKISEKNRLMNFESYWKLDSTPKKRSFIISHIELDKPIKSLVKTRGVTKLIHHFLDVENSDGTYEKVKVCKKMFLNTLGVSNTVLLTSIKLNFQYSDNKSLHNESQN
jgi:hypothetical protein